MIIWCRLYMGRDEARALVRALCNSSVSHMSLLCSMFQCFDFLVGQGHVWGMRLGTRPVYTASGMAFVAGITSTGWRCPKTLYAHKQRTGAIQNNNLLLQIASNKHTRLRGMKGKASCFTHKYIRVRQSRQLFTTSNLYTSVQWRYNSLVIILHSTSRSTTSFASTWTRIHSKKYVYNLAQVIYHTACSLRTS